MKDTKTTLLALIAIAATVGALWFINRPVTPVEATWEDVVAEAATGGYKLISTEELWERYSTKPDGQIIIDTRQEWEFRTGHIKGAINFPIEPTWISRWENKGEMKSLLGPDKGRNIVFY